jgi:hypothetical protein
MRFDFTLLINTLKVRTMFERDKMCWIGLAGSYYKLIPMHTSAGNQNLLHFLVLLGSEANMI